MLRWYVFGYSQEAVKGISWSIRATSELWFYLQGSLTATIRNIYVLLSFNSRTESLFFQSLVAVFSFSQCKSQVRYIPCLLAQGHPISVSLRLIDG